MCEQNTDTIHHPKTSFPVFDQDLNCLPNAVASSQLSQTPPGMIATQEKKKKKKQKKKKKKKKKKKRAASVDVARIAFKDVVKYFDLPIKEASRNLQVGVTVLKKKCREFGIPRWPHRKIKSLDTLIRDLQEEARQQEEDKAAVMAVAKRQRILQSEKEVIERKPFLEIDSETKRFRQDVFKRRHKAKNQEQ